ncbi:hydrogenase [Marinospirillum perlucidum]|uniref:hydrogenase n=1 Tax=Marinospirillum perlucidum TaxID=1982602 RepID=UPI000DF3FED0|nr:hydrogenase [Marinospirillum perlucidum]
MSHPLLDRLTGELGYASVTRENLDAFILSQPLTLLFFAGSPDRFPETLDVAVILPEIIKAFPDFRPGLVESASAAELQKRYGFSVWPTLVFLHQGQCLGQLSRVQNWDTYLNSIQGWLDQLPASGETGKIPAFHLN